MVKPLRVLGICGSLRAQSYNRRALHAAAACMPDGMQLHEASLAGIPLYDGDLEAQGFPPQVLRLAEEIRAADALYFASPEYNFSISGVLKNAIDWLSRVPDQPFRGKPVAMLSATQGPVGGARHQYELRKILGCLEAIVLPRPEVFIGLCAGKFDDDGLADAATRKVITDQMLAFAQWIARTAP